MGIYEDIQAEEIGMALEHMAQRNVFAGYDSPEIVALDIFFEEQIGDDVLDVFTYGNGEYISKKVKL